MANNVNPDQMPQNAASDEGLLCLVTGISINNKIKIKKVLQTPLKLEMNLSNIQVYG